MSVGIWLSGARVEAILKYYNNMQYKYNMISCYINILLLLYHRCYAMESDSCNNLCFHVCVDNFVFVEIPLEIVDILLST